MPFIDEAHHANTRGVPAPCGTFEVSPCTSLYLLHLREAKNRLVGAVQLTSTGNHFVGHTRFSHNTSAPSVVIITSERRSNCISTSRTLRLFLRTRSCAHALNS